jgi:hypothetical protein
LTIYPIWAHPEVPAQEILEELKAALEQLHEITSDLGLQQADHLLKRF